MEGLIFGIVCCGSIFSFLLFCGMLMNEYEFRTKENKIYNKQRIK